MKLFSSCKEAAKAIAEALEHDLPLYRRFALAFHMLICSACRRYRKQVIGLNRLVRRHVREPSGPVMNLDAVTRQRLVERLRQANTTPVGGTPNAAGDAPRP